jgi:hypothetical protein
MLKAGAGPSESANPGDHKRESLAGRKGRGGRRPWKWKWKDVCVPCSIAGEGRKRLLGAHRRVLGVLAGQGTAPVRTLQTRDIDDRRVSNIANTALRIACQKRLRHTFEGPCRMPHVPD